MKSEKRLVKKAKSDKQSFLKLYEHYFPKLYAFVLIRIKDKEQAEDIVQKTFLKALENIKKFKWRGLPFGAWLFRVAQNEIVNLYRENKPVKYYEQSAIDELDLPSESPEQTLIATEDELSQKQRYQRITQGLEHLKPEEKQVLLLKYISNLSYHQISKIMNKKPKHLAVILFRALKKLRTLLG